MESGRVKLPSLVLDDLQEELLRNTEIKYENHSLKNKWEKLRYYHKLVMYGERNGITEELKKKVKKQDTEKFMDILQGKKVEYFGSLKIMFHDAKSGSHLNGEKIDAVNIESDNVINLEDPSLEDSANDFEPHGVTQSSPSSNIASVADNCPTIPAEDTENILVNQTWVDDVEEEEDLEEASRECKRRKMSDHGRKALGRNLMDLPILSPPTEVVAPSSSGGPKAPQEASIEPSPDVPEKAPTAQPALGASVGDQGEESVEDLGQGDTQAEAPQVGTGQGHTAEGRYNFTSTVEPSQSVDLTQIGSETEEVEAVEPNDDELQFVHEVDNVERDEVERVSRSRGEVERVNRSRAEVERVNRSRAEVEQVNRSRAEVERVNPSRAEVELEQVNQMMDAGCSRKNPQKEVKKRKNSPKKSSGDAMVGVMQRYVEMKEKQAKDEVEFREKQTKDKVATGFSITRFMSVLKTVRGITTAEKVEAFDVFKLAENREIFINTAADEDGTNEDGTARMWLQSQMAKLP